MLLISVLYLRYELSTKIDVASFELTNRGE